MIDLVRELRPTDTAFPVIRLYYTPESIARAHADMLAEMAEQADTPDEAPE